VALRCRLCGEILRDRSVKRFMEHLEQEHTLEFVEWVERTLYEREVEA